MGKLISFSAAQTLRLEFDVPPAFVMKFVDRRKTEREREQTSDLHVFLVTG